MLFFVRSFDFFAAVIDALAFQSGSYVCNPWARSRSIVARSSSVISVSSPCFLAKMARSFFACASTILSTRVSVARSLDIDAKRLNENTSAWRVRVVSSRSEAESVSPSHRGGVFRVFICGVALGVCPAPAANRHHDGILPSLDCRMARHGTQA